jgi:DNA-binding MarR family transcriptional regulator
MPDPSHVTQEEWDVWRSFRTMWRQLDLALEHQLQRDADISAADFGVLMSLFEADGKQLRAGELSQNLGWEKSRVSHQVSRMEKRGLVERRLCDTDARGTWVGMTPSGSRAVLGAMRGHEAALREHFFDALSPTELAAIASASHGVLSTIEPIDCSTVA